MNTHLKFLQSFHPERFTLGQYATLMSSFCVKGLPISIHIDSKKLLLIVFKSFLIFTVNCLGAQIPTPPPLCTLVNDDLGW